MSRPLSPRQGHILAYILAYTGTYGVSPTMREIAEGVGLTTPSAVSRHLDALERQGYLHRHRRIPRGIVALRDPSGMPVDGAAVTEPIVGAGPPALGAAFRVIDLQSGAVADPEQIALDEPWAARLMSCDMDGFAVTEDGSLILLDECGYFAYCPVGRFRVEPADEEVWTEGEQSTTPG